MSTLLFWIAVLSYGAVILIIGFQVVSLRKRRLSVVTHESWSHFMERAVDALAVTIVMVAKEALHHASVFLLTLGQKIALIAKYGAHRLEKRFSGVITVVQGKRELSKQGDVSNFLQQIKHHQEQLRSEGGV